MERRAYTPETWLVTAGRPAGANQPLNTPIEAASTFVSDGGSPYARDGGTATWRAFEDVVGGLEHGHAVSFASGMAAVSAVFALLGPDARVVIPSDCYQGVAAVAAESAAAGRCTVRRLATDDTDGWTAASADADLVWFETPSNPLLVIGDLEAVAAAARPEGSLLVVDNTFATPLNQRPLDIGADISVQSVTKLIGGHSDLLSGVATTRSAELAERMRRHRQIHGATPGALESFLAVRGARTMALRLRQAEESAQVLAERLAGQPAVELVRYPGLVDHPGHDLAKAQLDGFGTMLSFDLRSAEAAIEACDRVELIRPATSLGAVESTMERRAGIPGQEHLPAGLIRFSVGIENVDDLWADLSRAIPAD